MSESLLSLQVRRRRRQRKRRQWRLQWEPMLFLLLLILSTPSPSRYPIAVVVLLAGTTTTTTLMLHVDAFTISTLLSSKTTTMASNSRTMRIINSSLSSSAVSSSSSAAAASSRSMKPMRSMPVPPPRFDVFSDRLVGASWTVQKTTSSAVTNEPGVSMITRSVEEVMRSCGGAVQGLREPFVVVVDTARNGKSCDGNDEYDVKQTEDDNDDDATVGLYLNRANDGFLFVDHGHYSYGPITMAVKVAMDDDHDDDEKIRQLHFVSNFMIHKDCRVLVSSHHTIGDLKSGCIQNNPQQCFMLRKQKFGCSLDQGDDDDDDNSVNETDTLSWIHDPINSITPTTIHDMLVCSMPSSSQPWMLQRAKWTKSVLHQHGDADIGNHENQPILLPPTIYFWSRIQSSKQFWEWMSLPDKLDDEDQGQWVQQMGIYCKESGQFQIMCRSYGESSTNGKTYLSKVSWIQGRADPEQGATH